MLIIWKSAYITAVSFCIDLNTYLKSAPKYLLPPEIRYETIIYSIENYYFNSYSIKF